jgi:hypothetical protein
MNSTKSYAAMATMDPLVTFVLGALLDSKKAKRFLSGREELAIMGSSCGHAMRRASTKFKVLIS